MDLLIIKTIGSVLQTEIIWCEIGNEILNTELHGYIIL